jgi:hypothetical protein
LNLKKIEARRNQMRQPQHQQFAILLSDGMCLSKAFPSKDEAVKHMVDSFRGYDNYLVVSSVHPADFLSVLGEFTTEIVRLCQEQPTRAKATIRAHAYVRDELRVLPVPTDKVVEAARAVWNALHPAEQSAAA